MTDTVDNLLTTHRFDKLPAEKKQTILDAAIEEFSRCGYEHANTNRIAESAGISVGALFTYFPGKQQIFEYLVRYGSARIQQLVSEILAQSLPLRDKIEQILRLILKSSREEGSLLRLYHELTAAGNAEKAEPLAYALETYTARAYEAMIREGLRTGELRPDLDVCLTAFHLDNLFMSLQYAYACSYNRARFRIYVNHRIDDAFYDERVIRSTMDFIEGALFNRQEEGDN